jgi:hypothetical protein
LGPRANVIKLFTDVIYVCAKKVRMFAPVSVSSLVYFLRERQELEGVSLKGKLLAIQVSLSSLVKCIANKARSLL